MFFSTLSQSAKLYALCLRLILGTIIVNEALPQWACSRNTDRRDFQLLDNNLKCHGPH